MKTYEARSIEKYIIKTYNEMVVLLNGTQVNTPKAHGAWSALKGMPNRKTAKTLLRAAKSY